MDRRRRAERDDGGALRHALGHRAARQRDGCDGLGDQTGSRSATSASLRTRPVASHSLHSRWPASSSSSARRPISEAMSDASARERVDQGLRHRAVRPAPVVLPANDETSAREDSLELVQRGEPDRVGVGHARPLRVGEGQALLQREGEPTAHGERARDLVSRASPCRGRRASSRAAARRRTWPAGSGGTRATSKRHVRPRARARAMSTALALESIPR